MGETDHIAEMAEVLSQRIFGEFFWSKVGPTNQNWPCEDEGQHKTKTHPSDVVFWYDEPYSKIRTYINCDLKSYAKSSISTSALRGAFKSLTHQVACAERSDEWRSLYVHDNVDPVVNGLLFVYNHDGEYDRDFRQHLSELSTEAVIIPASSKVVILGPEDIYWLHNVSSEIQRMRGVATAKRLPDPSACMFFHPQLVRKGNVQLSNARAATLEMLTSPFIVLQYQRPTENHKGTVIFYRRKGSSTQEFTYLLDYLRNYQVLESETEITIKLLDPASNATALFRKAAQTYVEGLAGASTNTAFAVRVQAITIEQISNVQTKFSVVELGMDYE